MDTDGHGFRWGEATDEPFPLRFAAPRPAREDAHPTNLKIDSAIICGCFCFIRVYLCSSVVSMGFNGNRKMKQLPPPGRGS